MYYVFLKEFAAKSCPCAAAALRHNYVYARCSAVFESINGLQRFAVVGISYSELFWIKYFQSTWKKLKNLKKSREIVRNRYNSAEINVNRRDLKMKTCCIENCQSRAADGDGISFFEYVL